MYTVSTYLARRPKQTVRVYTRGLQKFADHIGTPLSKLHEYLTTPKEEIVGDILTFGDTLTELNKNTQRLYVSCVMSYLSYNEIIIPKAQRKQAVPKPGSVFRDKALSTEEMKRVYEYLPPIGRAALLLMFSTGMRITEAITFKESDMEGRIIHLKDAYCKGGHGRDVVMTTECMNFLNEIWLPQRQSYIDVAVTKSTQKGGKSAKDDRVLPCGKANLYAILMLGFSKAGFSQQSDGRNLYHPHGLRKSFRTIVGSKYPDLAEVLLGHRGYLSGSYVRIEDLVKEYDKVEALLSMGSTEASISRLARVEQENAELKAKMEQILSGEWFVHEKQPSDADLYKQMAAMQKVLDKLQGK